MIVVIPLGGKGNRFKLQTKIPKALIKVSDRHIINYLLDNLEKSSVIEKVKFIYIPYNKEYQEYDFENILKNKYPNINFKFKKIDHDTGGAAETIQIGLEYIKERYIDEPVLCLDADNFYKCDILTLWNCENKIFTFKDFSDENKFSYVLGEKEIIDIKEKDKISDYACCGAYGFHSLNILYKYCKKIIDKNIKQKGEFYISGAIKEMIKDEIIFNNHTIQNKFYFSLGTPEQVKEYENPFLFDLDGTLVNTDEIYEKVWNTILSKFNLDIDNDFFKFFIQGKNDIQFLKYLFKDISDEDIIKISEEKDKLFIDNLKNYDKDISIKGSFDFIKKNKNRLMCIVTSCNKKSAEFIIKKNGLDEYIQFILASEDCVRHKPDRYPYEKAIELLDCDKNKCTIFEDSISGYRSALNSNVGKICLIIGDNTPICIKNNKEYKINDYGMFDENIISKKYNQSIEFIIKNALSDINLNIKDIFFNKNNIKTGYICDIQSFNIVTNTRNLPIVLKISNSDNSLAEVASLINLYNNEEYFYEKISSIINIEYPKFYCAINFNDRKAVILENLNYYNGNFNEDLNKNINLLLNVINNIGNLHNEFLFRKENDIINIMKPLLKVNQISYYRTLIKKKFNIFLKQNKVLLNLSEVGMLSKIFENIDKIFEKSSEFPLNFCHGDLKSPNIFYKNESKTITPIFLDWQYIHLNKGISDIAFLLTESINYDESTNDIVLNYYFKISEMYNDIDEMMFDFKISLCIFPFFVIVWFNSENRESLLDKVFPIRYMKNVIKYYDKYLDRNFFSKLQNLNVVK